MNRREALLTFLALPATTVITKTQIQAQDLLVITAPGHISEESAKRIKKFTEEVFNDLNIKVMVMGEGLTLSIVREGAKP